MKTHLPLLTTLAFCISFANATPFKQIQLSVCNQTDQTLIIEALYSVLPQKDPNLAGMPNPFIFVDAPANETTYALFKNNGGGRLGKLEKVIIRTRNEDGLYTFKTINAKELHSLNGEDMLMITIDKTMLP